MCSPPVRWRATLASASAQLLLLWLLCWRLCLQLIWLLAPAQLAQLNLAVAVLAAHQTTYVHTLIHITHTHIYLLEYTYAHTHAHTHIHIHTYTFAHTHIRTYTNAHTHAYTHTHAHIRTPLILPDSLSAT